MYIITLQSCIISKKEMIFCLKLYNLSVSDLVYSKLLCTLLCYNVIFIFCVYFIKVTFYEFIRHKIYLTYFKLI